MVNRIKQALRNILDSYRRIGYKNVHYTCHIGGNVKVYSKDNLLMAEQSNINAGAVIMNTRAKFVMGRYSGAAMNLFVATGNHMSVPGMSKREVTDAVKDRLDVNHEYDKDVIVDEDVWIGANVILLAGTHIGRGAIIGAGSVVRGNVPPYAVVSGNPAMVTSYRFKLDEIEYHEQKLYSELERLPKEAIEKGYYAFYGKPSAGKRKTEYGIDEYRDVFCRVFETDREKADSMEAYISDEWDSMGHMKLIVEMENTFAVTLSSEENRNFKSFAKGIEILKKKGVCMNEPLCACVFPGQGAQYVGMGKELYNNNASAKDYFEKANEILGFRITDIMFNGTEEELKKTEVTQPAIFLYSVIPVLVNNIKPLMAAGHSLGEFSALVASGALSFEDGLRLVAARANAMQKCCENTDGAMAAVLGLNDETIEKLCHETDGTVVAANYNCPGQVVISGDKESVKVVSVKLKEAGAKRIIPLTVGGAFHSPLMEPARKELSDAIANTVFHNPVCPVYQNVDGRPHTDAEEIKSNLLLQLTSPVRWTTTVQNMIADGMVDFKEYGPGNVLGNLIKKISKYATEI